FREGLLLRVEVDAGPLRRRFQVGDGSNVGLAPGVALRRIANTSATFSARAGVLACATFDATATTIPLSRRVISDITLPPASSPLTLSAFVARAKRTRSDGVE